MIRRSDISRITKTAKREVRENGLRGLFAAIHERWSLERPVFPYRRIKSVTLDGCTFSAEYLPVCIRLELLRRTYELPERRAVLQYIRPDLPVIELGGCIGVVACITNKLLQNPTAHVVVEASPRAVSHLKGNLIRNDCKFEILNAAVAYNSHSVTFAPSTDLLGNSLAQQEGDGPVTVGTVRLGDIASKNHFERFNLICDIEGYEYDLVKNEPEILQNVDTVVLETHARIIGEPATTELLDRLCQLGFMTVRQDSYVYVMRRSTDR